MALPNYADPVPYPTSPSISDSETSTPPNANTSNIIDEYGSLSDLEFARQMENKLFGPSGLVGYAREQERMKEERQSSIKVPPVYYHPDTTQTMRSRIEEEMVNNVMERLKKRVEECMVEQRLRRSLDQSPLFKSWKKSEVGFYSSDDVGFGEYERRGLGMGGLISGMSTPKIGGTGAGTARGRSQSRETDTVDDLNALLQEMMQPLHPGQVEQSGGGDSDTPNASML
jgi:hypothetical protein